MRFDELDRKMRVFETAHDHCALPGLFLVARLDGRGFTRLTKETHDFERPFDVRVRDLMAATAEHLMGCGPQVVYAYGQSDEISLLFHREEASFGRKLRKFESVLAGEASATFSLGLGALGAFDCRLSQLPREQDVVDYFRWRHEDAARNALGAHCYWLLRKAGASAREADAQLAGLGRAARNELLFSRGINFNELPAWPRRGFGLRWEAFEREGSDVRTGEPRATTRRRIRRDFELGMGADYDTFLAELVRQAGESTA
jgi:tRNA(His) guanylyltransferase